MSKPALVIVFRRDTDSLTAEERSALETAIESRFPGRQVEYLRTDPENYHLHFEQCEQLHPTLVLLPLERPIPAKAMEHGVIHVAMTPNGLKWLKSITVVFEELPETLPEIE